MSNKDYFNYLGLARCSFFCVHSTQVQDTRHWGGRGRLLKLKKNIFKYSFIEYLRF